MARAKQRQRSGPRAFTLVELLVAMSLGLILMGATVFIFAQSQKMFSEMDAKVKVYQYARTAFDQAERDLANTVKTADMEFFQDHPTQGSPGHYDFKAGDSEAIPVRDSGQKTHRLFSTESYIYAMTLHQPEPYDDGRGLGAESKHRHDSIYFRTVTSVNGQTRPVLVEYALDYRKRNGQLRSLPSLVRRHWVISEVDQSGLGGIPKLTLNANNVSASGPNEPIETELCLYVTDVEFEFYLIDKRKRALGRFFTAEEAVNGLASDPNGNFTSIRMRNFANDGFKIACFYDERYRQAGDDIAEYLETTGHMATQAGFTFPMSQPGDRIFVFDSDAPSFRSRDLTIKSIAPISGTNPRFGVQFVEQVPPVQSSAPPRLRFRTGWLPPMIRMKLRIKDEKSKAVRTMVRQFKLLGA